MVNSTGLLSDPLDAPADTAATADTTQSSSTGLLSAESPAQSSPTIDQPQNSPSMTEQPDSSAMSPVYDSKKALDAQVSDINHLVSKENPLMKQADTRAKQSMNQFGLLNSSMTAGAIENERLKTVMPMVEQNAGRRHDVEMLNLDTQSRASLIDLEQSWNAKMANNRDMAEAWSRNVDAIGKALSAGMTTEQTNAALDVMLGPVGADGVRAGGTMQATLTFIDSLDNFASGSVAPDAGQAQAATDVAPVDSQPATSASAITTDNQASMDVNARRLAGEKVVQGLRLDTPYATAYKSFGLLTTEKRNKLADWATAAMDAGFDLGITREDIAEMRKPRAMFDFNTNT